MSADHPPVNPTLDAKSVVVSKPPASSFTRSRICSRQFLDATILRCDKELQGRLAGHRPATGQPQLCQSIHLHFHFHWRMGPPVAVGAESLPSDWDHPVKTPTIIPVLVKARPANLTVTANPAQLEAFRQRFPPIRLFTR